MINRALFDKTAKMCGSCFTGGVSEDLINRYQNKLNVKFPYEYREFLKEFGEGSVTGTYIYGITDDKFASVVVYTEEFRKSSAIPQEYFVIIHKSRKKEHILICLDTTRMYNDECPAVLYDLDTNEVKEYKKDFDEVFNECVEVKYLERIADNKDKIEQSDIYNVNLPLGIGYKSCWLVINGSNQEAIAGALITDDEHKAEYREGLKEVKDTEYEGVKVMITSDYNNQNYVICDRNGSLFNKEWIEEKCRDFPQTYIYYTDRISETHGFARITNGNIDRLYLHSEEEIIDIGEPIEEELKNNIKLPHDFSEMRKHWNDNEYTKIDEDVIINIAFDHSAADLDKYPYDDVIVGKIEL